ncbi:hypothetical protein JYB64_14590 [Algoriphagus aestuarii]|nr:hypothetical protein [Algoriphagus aestuarii]
MVNSSCEAASVIRHRSSCQSSKENKVTGIIADNHIIFIGYEIVHIDLENNTSKSVKVGLAESNGIQIIDKKIKYEIEKITSDTLHLNEGDFLIKVKSSE